MSAAQLINGPPDHDRSSIVVAALLSDHENLQKRTRYMEEVEGVRFLMGVFSGAVHFAVGFGLGSRIARLRSGR
ncbi:hypothetical protein LTR85_002426 [Meristemomyces frigidus]|nr:hypothetical protein LTR85_002426 [Meristemomyces frigidus]